MRPRRGDAALCLRGRRRTDRGDGRDPGRAAHAVAGAVGAGPGALGRRGLRGAMTAAPTPALPDEVLEIARTLESAGYEAWCVGGALRDALLGHPTPTTTSPPPLPRPR